VRSFWTFLVAALLASLPVEGFSLVVEQEDTCSTCRCCVQTNTNPAPVRNAPTTAARTVRVDREARTESDRVAAPFLQSQEIVVSKSQSASLPAPSVTLFVRHCSFLI
jgi:hypothetical protein